MTPCDTLAAIRSTGRTVERTADRRISIRPALDAFQRSAALMSASGIRCLLDAESNLTGCARCSSAASRLVRSHWGANYCSPCCEALADELDKSRSWPLLQTVIQ
jgi:hypothetical protein